MVWLLILLVFLLYAIGMLIYALRISLNKINIYEDFIVKRHDAYQQLLTNIRQLDEREMFEKDEDVGVIFSDIKNEIEQFENLMEQ